MRRGPTSQPFPHLRPTCQYVSPASTYLWGKNPKVRTLPACLPVRTMEEKSRSPYLASTNFGEKIQKYVPCQPAYQYVLWGKNPKVRTWQFRQFKADPAARVPLC